MSLFWLLKVSPERGETKLREFGISIPKFCGSIIKDFLPFFFLEQFAKI
jgi:hypothetical protein